MTHTMQETSPGRLATLLWTAILTGHITVAVAWWWLMPGGFPLSSHRFWINQVAPVLVLALALSARIIWHRQREGLLAILLFLSTMWIGLALGLKAFFPITFKWLWFGPLIAGIVMTILARRSIRQPLNATVRLGTALGISFGAWATFTQQGLPPATVASNATLSIPTEMNASTGMVTLGGRTRVNPADGTLQILSPSAQLFIEPLLTFDSRSPDRCWTLFARRSLRRGPARELLGAKASTIAFDSWYASDFRQSLHVEDSDDLSLDIESIAELHEPIYSHLNTFTALTLTSIRSPKIGFSCIPEARFDITHGGYPFGKPHRFAYLGGDGMFRVVEASSAEKGPFRTLAQGALSRTESVGLLIYDGDTLLYTIEMLDWASQLSTQLSPTAGWGVPENSIEFSRASESPKSAVNLFITLANTSVGRGFDSAGHAPGVYRNRIRLIDHQR